MTDKCFQYDASIKFDPSKRDIDETWVDPTEGMDCVVDDNGQRICVDMDALADAAMDFAADIAGDMFGFGGSESKPEPKKEEPKIEPKNYKDGWECALKSDCKSGCCSSNFDIEAPSALDSHIDYDLDSYTLEQKLKY